MASWSTAENHPLGQWVADNVYALADKFVARADRGDKTWTHLIDRDAVALAIRDAVAGHGPLKAIIVEDTHLFVYTVASPWWDSRPWMMEQFYCRLRPGRGDPLAAVEELARDLGCAVVGFATSFAPRDAALGRLLARSGYIPQSSQHMKEL